MYGEGPSEPAVHAAAVFKASGAREGFSVMATDGLPRTGSRTRRRFGAGGDEERQGGRRERGAPSAAQETHVGHG
ncbi:hypothetical protein [Streptomyces antarcticus]|uniref:hypothetical protein n=1 Tax=Streptomyces antarcticus TaxID=2996458 RepID=UPI002270A606|nr:MULTISPECIES: hypothetical protein [unclassified Streptomyces]MCY0941088.1 hypothetical protein [Streptomyces sp. H34-AA3]MCZ4084165.1 hypothetical protein [Streptomyces sp. H34-S5]